MKLRLLNNEKIGFGCKLVLPFAMLFATFAFCVNYSAFGCTNLLVTKGASADGSVMITYTADSAGFHGKLKMYPAADHKADDVIVIPATEKREEINIPQVAHTYQVIGCEEQGCINEFQLAMAETTFGGRDELLNPKGAFDYPTLMTLGLQRAKKARQAIEIMVELVEEYGWADGGESISVCDTDEAWVLEIVGTGDGGSGAVWVAMRVPDGHISVHANQARIGEFPKNDPTNCFFSENVESFAIEKGWYDPTSGKPFRFDDAYAPPDIIAKRVCEARVWSIYRRAAPSQNFLADYHRGVEGSQPYPWSIKADWKLSVADVMGLMRDHYDGTEFDMTQGIDAGEYGLPRRWRPLTFEVEGKKYAWERPISTQQTGYSIVTQSRSWLPDPVGGILWYGVDDSYLTCYFPIYCCAEKLPKSFQRGGIERFSWNDAWWVFNLVSNYANLKYDTITPDIIAVQKDLESAFIAIQPAIDKTAKELAETNPNLCKTFLTDYTVMSGEKVFERWKELAEDIITKYNDGYVRSPEGKYPNVGYPDKWLKRVVDEKGDALRLPDDAGH